MKVTFESSTSGDALVPYFGCEVSGLHSFGVTELSQKGCRVDRALVLNRMWTGACCGDLLASHDGQCIVAQVDLYEGIESSRASDRLSAPWKLQVQSLESTRFTRLS